MLLCWNIIKYVVYLQTEKHPCAIGGSDNFAGNAADGKSNRQYF